MKREYLHGVAHVKKVGDTLYIASEGEGVVDEKTVIAAGADTPRNLADRFGDVVNVKDFGAVGDGKTDDTEALNHAIKYACDNKKIVFMPSGIYMTSKRLQIFDNTDIRGQVGTTEIRLYPSTRDTIIYYDYVNSDDVVNNVHFDGIIFNSNAEETDNFAVSAISLSGVTNLSVTNCVFKNATGYGLGLQAYKNAVSGLDGNVENIFISNCIFDHNGFNSTADNHDGLDIKKGKNIFILNCIAKNNADTGINIRGENIVIDSCEAYGNINCGIGILFGIYTMNACIKKCDSHNNNRGIVISETENDDGNLGYAEISDCHIHDNTEINLFSNFAEDYAYTDRLSIIVSNSLIYNCPSGHNIYIKQKNAVNVCFLCCHVFNATHGIRSNSVTKISNCSIFSHIYSAIYSDNSIISNSIIKDNELYAISGSGNYLINCIIEDSEKVSSTENNFFSQCVFTNNGQSVGSVSVKYGTNKNGALLQSCGQDDIIDLRIGSKGTGSSIRHFIGDAELYGEDDAAFYSRINLALGKPQWLWSQVYASTGSINTSDEREKQDVAEYPDEVLDAWGEVTFRQFLFKDAVDAKGEAARIHAGVIAQQVVEAFEKHSLDATRYGLLCYDKWEDEYETVEVEDAPAVLDSEGNEVAPAKTHAEKRLVTAAGDRYGIRYSEALCLEAAYQRRRARRLESSVSDLETRLAALEKAAEKGEAAV